MQKTIDTYNDFVKKHDITVVSSCACGQITLKFGWKTKAFVTDGYVCDKKTDSEKILCLIGLFHNSSANKGFEFFLKHSFGTMPVKFADFDEDARDEFIEAWSAYNDARAKMRDIVGFFGEELCQEAIGIWKDEDTSE